MSTDAAIKTGIIYGEANAAYHANGAVSSSKLGDMRIAGKIVPLNYYLRHITKSVPRKDGAHFDIGIAGHLLVLEGPAAFAAGTLREPDTYKNEKGVVKPWSNNAAVCKEWHELQKGTGRIVLSKEETALIQSMATAIVCHPEANALTTLGSPEVTFRTNIAGLTLQCRVDKWHKYGILNVKRPVIVDLKTCATIEQFEKDYYYKRYNFRAEFYRLVCSQALAEEANDTSNVEKYEPDYIFVVVEKTVPYRVKVFTPDAESLAAGRKEVHADLVTLKACIASGIWPSGTEGMHEIGLKTWQLAKSDETSNAAIEGA